MTIRKKIIFCFIILSVLSWNNISLADEIRFEATVNRKTVSLGKSLQLNLTFQGTQDASPPDIGKIDGFQAQYLGPSTRMSIVNGKASSSITYIYSLIPLETGTFQVGPFSVSANGKAFASEAISIEVTSGPVRQKPGAHKLDSEQEVISEEKLKDRIFLVFECEKTSLYVNESVPVSIKLYVNRLSVRDIQYPEFKQEGFSIKEFGEPEQYRQTIGDVAYDVVKFNAYMFPVKPGELTLGPAEVKCSIVVRKQQKRRRSSLHNDVFDGFFNDNMFDNFFGRYQAYPLKINSPPLIINVQPLPDENKPHSFAGAIGNFRLKADASPKEIKAGDPITLKIKISGEGNLDTVTSPLLSSKEGFKVYEPEVKQENGSKVFEQVLIPQSEKVKEIPELIFSFFNPKTKEYQTLTKGPFPITVQKAEGGELKIVENQQGVTKTIEKESLGRDIVYIKESPGSLKEKDKYLYKRAGFWLYITIISIMFFAFLVFCRHNEKLKTDKRYARRLQAPAKARKGISESRKLLRQDKKEEFFDVLHKTLHGYLADKFHLSAGRVGVNEVKEVLGESNVEEKILEKMTDIFSSCDMARYAPLEFDRHKREQLFDDMCEVIDYLERKKV